MTKPRIFGIAGATLALSICLVFAADRAREQKYQQAVDLLESKGEVKGAIKLFEDVAKSPDRNLAARSLLYLGSCYEKLGQDGAHKAYERIVREFGDQADVSTKARSRLSALGKPADTGVVARRIWSGAGSDYRLYTSISQDGRYATFLGNRNTIHVHDLVTNETRQSIQIPYGGWVYAEPVYISPDGKQIAYGIRADPQRTEIHVIAVDSSNDRFLIGAKDLNVVPQGWSPDGAHIIARVRSLQHKEQIQTVLVSVSDGSSRVISPGLLQSSQFSPDGRSIVFESPLESKQSNILLMPANGGAQTPLLENSGTAVSLPMWSPDGKRVLFLDDRHGGRDLWSVRVDDGKREGSPELIKEHLGWDRLGAIPVGVSRDGGYYYNSVIQTSDLYTVAIDPGTHRSTSPPRNFGRYFNKLATWSSEGDRIAYLSRRDPKRTGAGFSLAIRSIQTGEERVLTTREDLDLAISKPHWSGDGRSVLLHARPWALAGNLPAGEGTLYRADLQTGEFRTVPGSEGITSAWAADAEGRILYYMSWNTETKQNRIFRRELYSGGEKQLYITAKWAEGPSVSPDGRQLAFIEDDDTRLLILPTAGGTPRELYHAPKDKWVGPPVWDKDGKRLFFVSGEEIWSISADGGEAQSLGIGPIKHLWSIDLSPDGKQLVFNLEQRKSEFWVLKNLFGAAKASH